MTESTNDREPRAERQGDTPLTRDPPRSPGTPEPPDLDVEVDVEPEEYDQEREVPTGQDVTADASTPEPSD